MSHGGWPVRHSLTLTYILSFVIAVLMAAASIAGLLFTAVIYPAEELTRTFVPNDVVSILIGVPILLGSMGLARRGRLIGLLCWPGALFFVLYNYIIYVLAVPLTTAFLLHLALMAISLYTLIGLVASIDGKAVQQQLAGAVPERVAGGILAALGLLFLLRSLAGLVGVVASKVPMANTERALMVGDFMITPAWIIGGVMLWRRKALGYVSGLGLLFQASMLFVALLVFFMLQPLMTDAPFALIDFVIVFTMGSVSFVPFALFWHGVASRARHRS